MKLLRYLSRNWELVFAFGPLALALFAFVVMSAVYIIFDLPPLLDTELYMAKNPGQRFGIIVMNLLWPMFVVCGLVAVPFLIAGLTVFALRKLRTRQLHKKSVKLQNTIKELRKKNAKD